LQPVAKPLQGFARLANAILGACSGLVLEWRIWRGGIDGLRGGDCGLGVAVMLKPVRGSFMVLGRAGMDLYADPPGARIEDARTYVAHLGGSAANIAAALSRHGCETGLLTRVSNDAVGRFCLAELDRYGINRNQVALIGGEHRTSLAVVETRAMNCQSVIYRNGAADFSLQPSDVLAVNFQAFSTLVVTGTALATTGSRSAVKLAISRAKEAGLTVVMDVDYRPYSWPNRRKAASVCLDAASECDIIVGNDEEFGLMAGGIERGLAKARALAANGATVVYKMGPKGAVTLTSDDEFTTGIYKVNALKPTGAGDAFLGGFLAALAADRPLREAVLRGSASAAIVVSRVGCAPAMPTSEELDAFLLAQPEPEAE
jgi:5-dehydro-2-deoxygluconokinase